MHKGKILFLIIPLIFVLGIPPDSSFSNEVDPPKKQMEQGIPPNQIICKKNLELIFKLSDNSPACVKPTSITPLIERGWGSISISIRGECNSNDDCEEGEICLPGGRKETPNFCAPIGTLPPP